MENTGGAIPGTGSYRRLLRNLRKEAERKNDGIDLGSIKALLVELAQLHAREKLEAKALSDVMTLQRGQDWTGEEPTEAKCHFQGQLISEDQWAPWCDGREDRCCAWCKEHLAPASLRLQATRRRLGAVKRLILRAGQKLAAGNGSDKG